MLQIIFFFKFYIKLHLNGIGKCLRIYDIFFINFSNTLVCVHFELSNKKFLPNRNHKQGWLLLRLIKIYNRYEKLPYLE